jgi:DNA-binding MarR family transcriptional regulator
MKQTADYPLGPELDFLRRLWRLNHALERVSSRMEERLGVTAQQRLIVRCVGKYPGLTAGQLAGLLHLDPGTVSASLRRLGQRGLVERRPDPRDRRRVTLGLTEEGRRVDQPSVGTVEAATQALLKRVPSAELSSTAQVIEQLADLLEAVPEEPPAKARSGRRRPRPRSRAEA